MPVPSFQLSRAHCCLPTASYLPVTTSHSFFRAVTLPFELAHFIHMPRTVSITACQYIAPRRYTTRTLPVLVTLQDAGYTRFARRLLLPQFNATCSFAWNGTYRVVWRETSAVASGGRAILQYTNNLRVSAGSLPPVPSTRLPPSSRHSAISYWRSRLSPSRYAPACSLFRLPIPSLHCRGDCMALFSLPPMRRKHYYNSLRLVSFSSFCMTRIYLRTTYRHFQVLTA